MSWRERLGWRLRCWADRIDRDNATFCLSGYSFTFEDHKGIVFREDGKGCPLAYIGKDDYERAHTESDTTARALERDRQIISTFKHLPSEVQRSLLDALGWSTIEIPVDKEK